MVSFHLIAFGMTLAILSIHANERDCNYIKLKTSDSVELLLAPGVCMNAESDDIEAIATSTAYLCVLNPAYSMNEDNGERQYEVILANWDGSDCQGSPSFNESWNEITDNIDELNSGYKCNGNTCAITYRQYAVYPASNPACPSIGYADLAGVPDLCQSYEGYDYRIVCEDSDPDVLKLEYYFSSGNATCEGPAVEREFSSGDCVEVNGTYFKYDVNCTLRYRELNHPGDNGMGAIVQVTWINTLIMTLSLGITFFQILF